MNEGNRVVTGRVKTIVDDVLDHNKGWAGDERLGSRSTVFATFKFIWS